MKKFLLLTVFTLLLLLGVPVGLWIWDSMRPGPSADLRERFQTFLAPVTRLAAWGSMRLSNGLEFVVTTDLVRKRVEHLEGEVAELQAENGTLRAALAKYERLDGTISLASGRGWKNVSANVVAYGNRTWVRCIEINRGASHGVEPGDPVLHTRGLAGVVTRSGRWTSTVQLLCNPQTEIGVVVHPSRVQGVVRGIMGRTDVLEVQLRDPSRLPQRGDLVSTSGMAESLYPGGIAIGIVGELSSQTLTVVRPIVPFDQIEEVLVLTLRDAETLDASPSDQPVPQEPETAPPGEDADRIAE